MRDQHCKLGTDDVGTVVRRRKNARVGTLASGVTGKLSVKLTGEGAVFGAEWESLRLFQSSGIAARMVRSSCRICLRGWIGISSRTAVAGRKPGMAT